MQKKKRIQSNYDNSSHGEKESKKIGRKYIKEEIEERTKN